MQDTVRVALRMRDVGLALRAAGQHGISLNRVGLQKFVYVTDAITAIFGVLPPAKGHETFKHGPYDRFIQNAVDCLCFRGMARITQAIQINGFLSTEYALTKAGEGWASRLGADSHLDIRWKLVQRMATELSKTRSWHRLRDLAYAEPTFVAARPSGWGQPLRLGDATQPSAAALLQLMKLALEWGAGREPGPDLLVGVFVRYLHQYATLQRGSEGQG